MRWALIFLAGSALGGAVAFLAVGGWIWLEDRVDEVSAGTETAALDPAKTAASTGDAKPTNGAANDANDANAAIDSAAGCPVATDESPPWALGSAATGEAEPLQLAEPSKRLARRIRFWEQVWGKVDEHAYIFFDKRRPSLIHGVVDCANEWEKIKDPKKADKACDKKLIARKRKIVKVLKKQRRRPSRVLRKALDNDKSLIRNAWANVLVLEGKADKIKDAKVRAAPHMKRIEAVFTHVGVPEKLSRLAFSESLFQPSVVSRSKAVGAFQFMAPTAKQWLQVNDRVDERLDPVRSAYASASYLKQMNKGFDDWALTLTGYNTGPSRMSRLVKRHRTRDIGLLADKRTERRFGFDGQNYYASFYAVSKVTDDVAVDPGPIDQAVISYDADIPLAEVARCRSTTVKALAEVNPSLRAEVVEGKREVPKGYMISLPMTSSATVANNATAPENKL